MDSRIPVKNSDLCALYDEAHDLLTLLDSDLFELRARALLSKLVASIDEAYEVEASS